MPKLAKMKTNYSTADFLEERKYFGTWNYLITSTGDKIPFSSAYLYPLNPAKVLKWWMKQYLAAGRADPLFILLRSINSCCDDCFFCQTKTLRIKKPNLDEAHLKQLINEIGHSRTLGVRFDGLGEPFLIHNLAGLVYSLRQDGKLVFLISNSTSAIKDLTIIARNIDFVRFSLDAATSKTHTVVHRTLSGNDFMERLNNIRKLCQIRNKYNKSCLVGTHFVINQKNYGEIIKFTKVVKQLGVDFADFCLLKTNTMFVSPSIENYRTVVIKSLLKAKKLVDENFHLLYRDDRDDYSKLKQKLAAEYINRDGFCWHSLLMPAINSYGDVIGCGKYEEQAQSSGPAAIGNIKLSPFFSIWHNHQIKLKRFKSVYCKSFGPCYFTYVNYAVSWIKSELEKQPDVRFARARVDGKNIDLIDKL